MKKIIISLTFIILSSHPLLSGNWWQLYFTSPGKSTHSINIQNPETGLINTINHTKKSIYAAFYDISSPHVITSLIQAKKRGCAVAIVTEGDNSTTQQIQRMIDAGINIVHDNRSGLMHNKFAIFDGKFLWTGSYNPTLNGVWKNNNNAIKIYSLLLSKIYTNEFMEMYKSKIFGNRREYGPFAQLRKKYYVKIEKTAINVYFSPDDNVEKIILKRLKKAKKTIYFMAFSMTSNKIGEMLIKKHREGIRIYGLFERRGARSEYSEYIKLKIEGVPVKLDRNRGMMHHKVIIIDGKRVITGSYNFSKNANTKNDENILIIDNKSIANQYITEFQRCYGRVSSRH